MSTAEILRDAAAKLDAAGVESGRFEAQLLLGLSLGVSRAAIIAGLHPEPTPQQRQEFARLIGERARRVPLAYLRGSQEFYGLEFIVSPAVLVPRPETELLVEFALEKLGSLPPAGGKSPNSHLPSPLQGEGPGMRVEAQAYAPPFPVSAANASGKGAGESGFFADVGTGSGCIPIAVLKHCPQARAVAVDISPPALAVARNNAAMHAVTERVRFLRGDLADSLETACFDLIVSNPPYIPTSEVTTLQPEVRDFEPRLALDGGADGLTLVRRLLAGAGRALRPGGWLAMEIALGQAESVSVLFREAGLQTVSVRRDLAGIERIVTGQKRL